jgi:CheY-like chemotaxis protein
LLFCPQQKTRAGQVLPGFAEASGMSLHHHLKSKCLVVEASSKTFGMIEACLKDQGVVGLQRAQDLSRALELLEAESFSWVIAGSGLGDPVNLVQFLSVILREEKLRTTYVSLLYDNEESQFATTAFEFGLFSCAPKFEHKSQCEDIFRELWRREAQWRGEVPAIAANYLGDLLVAQNRINDLVQVRQNLVEHFPGHMEFLLKLAESKAMSGEIVSAAATLTQVKMIAPSLQFKVDEIKARYLPQVKLGSDLNHSETNILEIHRAVVVDPDESVVNSVLEILESLGAKGVEAFLSPDEALQYLKGRPDQDLLIHEWKMPKISGPMFIQRVRQLGLERTPVILCSSQVSEKDQQLTREMGVATVVSKPFKRGLLLESVIWTMKQEHRPTEIRIVERKIQGLLSRNNVQKARQLLKKLKAEKKLPESGFGYFEAEIMFHQKKLELAKGFALDSLRRGFISVRLYHLIGKILMRLGDFESAIKFLEKAQELSPNHVTRLCMLADANCELGRTQASRNSIDQATSLDPTHTAVAHSEITLSFSSGDQKKAAKILQGLELFDEVVSYLNNRAVALSRAGRLKESIDCYQKALASLPPKAEAILASLYYNLSLAHIRSQDLGSALKALKLIGKSGGKVVDEKFAKKVQSLKTRLQNALAKGESFTLKVEAGAIDKDSVGEAPSQLNELTRFVDVGPGDYALYKIFVDHVSTDKDKLVKSLPRFVARGPGFGEAFLATKG